MSTETQSIQKKESNIQIPRKSLAFVFFIAKQNAMLGIFATLAVTIAQLSGVFLQD